MIPVRQKKEAEDGEVKRAAAGGGGGAERDGPGSTFTRPVQDGQTEASTRQPIGRHVTLT